MLDADEAAVSYRKAVSQFIDDYRRDLHRDGHEHVLMPTDVPVQNALRSYLLRRSADAAAVTGHAPGPR